MKISFLLIGRGLFLRLIKHCSIHRCTLGGKRRFGIWKFDLMSATPEVGAIPKRRRNLFLNNLLRNPFLTILALCQTLWRAQNLSLFFWRKTWWEHRERDWCQIAWFETLITGIFYIFLVPEFVLSQNSLFSLWVFKSFVKVENVLSSLFPVNVALPVFKHNLRFFLLQKRV